MTNDIINSLRLRLASSAPQKQLAKTALEQEEKFLQVRKELNPARFPEEDRKVYTALIEDAQDATVLGKALTLAGKAHPSPADDEAAKQRAKVLLGRAFQPYVASVVALLKGAEDEINKALSDVEKDEVRLFQKWNCPPAPTYLRAGAQQLAARLKEQVAALSDPSSPHLRPGKLGHWIRYAAGEVNPGTE